MKNIIIGAFMLFFAPTTQAQIISTVAGTGVAGFSGDGGMATDAMLYYPHGLATDAHGNIFIADQSNYRIRKLTPSGTITTIVGTGTYAYNGSGIPALSSNINKPFDIETAADGRIFVADTWNGRIRVVDAAGTITTIGGNGSYGYSGDYGPATAASFRQPSGLVFDGTDNLYIADQFNHRVRKINLTTGKVTTVAGNGFTGSTGDGGPATSARLYFPNYLYMDAANNLYITDNGNHKIRKVTPAGIIQTFAGSGSAGFSGDSGPATAANLYYPGGITMDAQGNFYIADHQNHRIRKINTSGIITTFAGDGTESYGGDGGPATAAQIRLPTDVVVDANENLIICDFRNHRIRKIPLNNGPVFSRGAATPLAVCSVPVASADTALSVIGVHPGETITWSVIQTPAHGSLSGFPASTVASTVPQLPPAVNFTPISGYTGKDTFSVSVSDGTLSDTIVLYVSIGASPDASFSVNDTSQNLSGNSFTFTPVNSVPGNIHTWVFNDASPVSGSVTATHAYGAIGVYSVMHTLDIAGCQSTAAVPVFVLSDGVGEGGGEGGLESESLGGLVGKMEFNRIKNSIDKHVDYTKAIKFQQVGSAAKGSSSGDVTGRLQYLLPESLNGTTTPMISSPSEITTITTAVDVFALDYVANNKAKAVVLGITTLDRPYSHTKSVCDRFKGSTLLHTEVVHIKGFKFIRFALQKDNGDLEFCITFDAGKSAGRSTFALQTSWLINQYAGDDSVFNFQTWAADPDNAVALTEKILSNLESIMPVVQTDLAFALPKAYIASGRRNKNSLDLVIANSSTVTSAEIRFEEKLNEQSDIRDLSVPVVLSTGTNNRVSIPINDGYEYPGYLYINGELTDVVYMSDGNWSIDYDKTYTSISRYLTLNDPDRIYTDNEYAIYRSLSLKAITTDYISAYKFISSGNKPVDLSAHRSLKFHAQGTGKVNVMLIKDGIVKWNAQYYKTIELAPEGRDYEVSLADFLSDINATPFSAEDVTAVVFTWSLGGKETQIDFTASRIAFSPDEVKSDRLLRVKSLSVVPNPTNGAFEIKFQSEKSTEYDLHILDISGRLVYKGQVAATIGENTVHVTIPQNIQRPSVLTITMGNRKIAYSATKMILTK